VALPFPQIKISEPLIYSTCVQPVSRVSNKFSKKIMQMHKKYYFCPRRNGRVVDCGSLENC
jgi:hypothetical protein